MEVVRIPPPEQAVKTIIRDAIQEDLRLVADSWCKSLLGQSRRRPRGCSPLCHMDRSTYFHKQAALIQSIIQLSDTSLLVMCPEDDQGMVLGWICGAPRRRVLHFLYVGGLYRQYGYATRLMDDCFASVGPDEPSITVSHWTRCVPFYLRKWNLRYDPFESV